MVLANRAKLQNSRSLVRVFGGLNETYACSEAEYSAGVNFSARDFPALSTRKPRRKLRELTGLNGMYHLNGLLTVCGKDLIYTPDARRREPGDLHRGSDRRQKGTGGHWYKNPDLPGQGSL